MPLVGEEKKCLFTAVSIIFRRLSTICIFSWRLQRVFCTKILNSSKLAEYIYTGKLLQLAGFTENMSWKCSQELLLKVYCQRKIWDCSFSSGLTFILSLVFSGNHPFQTWLTLGFTQKNHIFQSSLSFAVCQKTRLC